MEASKVLPLNPGAGLTQSVMTVTPELAAQWLERNTSNRPLAKKVVARYAREMREGHWRLNGESIKLDEQGIILDGQHRLHAIVEAQVAIETAVVIGLPADVFPSLDRGAKRTLGHNLSLMGEVCSAHLGAAIVHQWKYENGVLDKGGVNSMTPEIATSLDVLGRNPGLRDAIRASSGVKKLMPSSIAAFLYYQFHLRNASLAEWFFARLADGAGIQPDEPVYRLRERLLSNRLNAKAKFPNKEILALVIKAWNHTVEGRRVAQIRWRSTGRTPEAFPTIEPVIGGVGQPEPKLEEAGAAESTEA